MASFVECLPAQFVQKTDSVHNGYVYLRAKFNITVFLAPDYWTNVRLMNAHYAMRYRMYLFVVHLFLLLVNRLNNIKIFELMTVERHLSVRV